MRCLFRKDLFRTVERDRQLEGDRQEQHRSMATRPSCSSSSKEAKKFRCLRAPRKARNRAGTWISSLLSNCSSTTAGSPSSGAALAGRLQSWRSHSTFRDDSFWDKHWTRWIYKSALGTEGTFSSKTRETGRDRRRTCGYKKVLAGMAGK